MPSCGRCLKSCDCFISEDGFRAGSPELGRNFTVINGNGTAQNPYTFSFLDSMAFRPRTAEIVINNTTLPEDSVTTLIAVPGSSYFVYESPIDFVFRDPLEIEDYKNVAGDYFIFGASVTFAELNVAVPNVRGIVLTNVRDIVNPAGSIHYVMAGQTAPASVNDPLTLSCEAFWPGQFFPNFDVAGVNHQVSLHVIQRNSTDTPILLSDIRIWMTQI